MSIYALKRLNLSKHLIVSAFEGCLILQNELLVEKGPRRQVPLRSLGEKEFFYDYSLSPFLLGMSWFRRRERMLILSGRFYRRLHRQYEKCHKKRYAR